MKIVAARECEGLAHIASKFLDSQSVDIQGALSDMTLHIGPSNNSKFRTPAHARDAIYVGDGAHMGTLIADAATKQVYMTNPKQVRLNPKWNSATNKWDMVASRQITADAAPDLLSGQVFAPWSQSFFQGVFERPLLYSHASKLVKREAGDKPWAEVMNLYLADYGGSAVSLNKGGSVENSETKDVTVTSGMMTAMVMNMYVTYSLTIEEQEGAKVSDGNPFGSQMIQTKIKYANYVLDLLTDYLTYFGNADTDTVGLFNVNSITAYAGNSIKSVKDGTSATKGSDIYANLYTLINDFVGKSYNKFNHLKVAMSTFAYNYLNTVPYSANYNPKSPLTIMRENFGGGKDVQHGDGDLRIDFYADPMLDANSEFNGTGNDYLVITAPEVGTGPEDTKKGIILQGMPLKEFAYPVIPGMINTQHRILRRYAGVYAPVTDSVAVFSGFGVKSTD